MFCKEALWVNSPPQEKVKQDLLPPPYPSRFTRDSVAQPGAGSSGESSMQGAAPRAARLQSSSAASGTVTSLSCDGFPVPSQS